MRASIETLAHYRGEARWADIEAREATLEEKEEEYEQLKNKKAKLVERLALDMRYQEVEQELMERFVTKERELLGKASSSQLRIGQLVQDQVGVDQEAEEMEPLIQKSVPKNRPTTRCLFSNRTHLLNGVYSTPESSYSLSGESDLSRGRCCLC